MGSARRLRHERVGGIGADDDRRVPKLNPGFRSHPWSTTTSRAIWAPSAPGAALVKRATEGGSWHVTVSLTRTAMSCMLARARRPCPCGLRHARGPREPVRYDAPSPLGDVHMLAPPVRLLAHTTAWPGRRGSATGRNGVPELLDIAASTEGAPVRSFLFQFGLGVRPSGPSRPRGMRPASTGDHSATSHATTTVYSPSHGGCK